MDWMKKFCMAADEHYIERMHGIAKEPLALTGPDGEAWTWASDARFAVVVRHQATLIVASEQQLKAINAITAQLFDTAEKTLVPVSLRELAEWCEPPVLKEECDECSGTGLCSRCRCDQEHECGYCGGTGEVKADIRAGRLFEFLIDRNRLAIALSHLLPQFPGEDHATVCPAHPNKVAAFVLATKNWRFILTCIEDKAGHGKYAACPVFATKAEVTA